MGPNAFTSCWSILLATLCLIASHPVAAQDGSEAADPLAETRALFEQWNTNDAPGVAVAVSIEDELVLSEGFGLADVEQGTAIGPNTRFHAASVSKQFTAFAILSLVDEGQLRLEDDIRDILPELSDLPAEVTIAHLLNHTSGLREVGTLLLMAGWLPDDIVTQHQQFGMIARQQGFNFQPGGTVEYSNTGYALLAKIVEVVSEQDFATFMQERVFGPLDMTDTMVQQDRSVLIPGLARSYNPTRSGLRNSVLNREIVGSTGIITSIADLIKWAHNFDTQTVGNERVFAMMEERPFALDGAEAIFARGQEQRIHNGIETWLHGGRIAGYRTFLLRAPAHGLSIALLSNRGDFDGAQLAFDIADIFLRDAENFQIAPEPEWQPATQEELDRYSGLYELFPGTIFDISNADGQLQFATYGSDQAAALEQSGPGEFVLSAAAGIYLRFADQAGGPASEVEYVLGLNGSLRASRTSLTPHDPDQVQLSDFTGVFYSEELQTRYELRLVDGTLMAYHSRLASFGLSQLEVDTFTAPGTGLQKLRFDRGADGEVIGLTVSSALAENLAFRKMN